MRYLPVNWHNINNMDGFDFLFSFQYDAFTGIKIKWEELLAHGDKISSPETLCNRSKDKNMHC